MSSSRLALSCAIIAAILAGCGESEVKRAVDPRTEVLRFFPEEASFVSIVRMGPVWKPGGEAAALAELTPAVGLFTWLRAEPVLREVFGAGSAAKLPGVAALGPGPRAGASETVVIGVIATAPERLDELVGQAEKLEPVGSFHDARLYTAGEGTAYAVRDGVLVLAASPRQARAALARRDGDRDELLDDGRVSDVLEELPDAPLQAYLRPEPEIPAEDAGVAIRLTQDVPELLFFAEDLDEVPARTRDAVRRIGSAFLGEAFADAEVEVTLDDDELHARAVARAR